MKIKPELKLDRLVSKYGWIKDEEDVVCYVKEIYSSKIIGAAVPFVRLGYLIVLDNDRKVLIKPNDNGKALYGKEEFEDKVKEEIKKIEHFLEKGN